MAIGTQSLAINPGMGNRREQLFPIGAHHFCRHGRGRHFHKHHMVQPYPVKGILQRQYALNFMGTNHGIKHVLHGQRRPALCHLLLR